MKRNSISFGRVSIKTLLQLVQEKIAALSAIENKLLEMDKANKTTEADIEEVRRQIHENNADGSNEEPIESPAPIPRALTQEEYDAIHLIPPKPKSTDRSGIHNTAFNLPRESQPPGTPTVDTTDTLEVTGYVSPADSEFSTAIVGWDWPTNNRRKIGFEHGE